MLSRAGRTARVWALVAWVVAAPGVRAENALNEAAKREAHQVLCAIDEDHLNTGSGFLVDRGRRLVTNWHVVECLGSARRPQGKAAIILADERMIPLRLEWHSERKDLAVLELETPLDAAVTFARRAALEERDKVIVAGFPGPALRVDRQVGQLSFSEGIVSKFTEIGGVRHIQTTAPTHHGNSGGPLYDEWGRVAGIMKGGATAELEEGRGQVMAAGISYAILADELLEELDRLGIAYAAAQTREAAPANPSRPAPSTPAPSQPEPAASTRPAVGTATLALLGLVLLFLAGLIGRRVFAPAREEPTPRVADRSPAPAASMAAHPARLRLRCLAGADVGSAVPLDREPLYLGRDAARCQWVMPRSAHRISRRHCCLRWDGGRRVMLEDCGSANGTFLADGRRLPAGQPVPLGPGDRFYLGNRRFEFQLEGS